MRVAEELWAELQRLPYEEQRALVMAVRFHTRDFLDLLGEQCPVASRQNRQRGVEVAELAVLSAETSVEALGEAAYDLLALAYAWLAVAKRLALDYPGAEEAIRKAETTWEMPRAQRNRQVVAEILRTKGSLRLHQGRFDEALDLVGRAIMESQLSGATRVLAQSLICRAQVIDYGGAGTQTVPDLRQALRILKPLGEPRLTLATHISLANAYTVAGRSRESLRLVADARALCEELPAQEQDPIASPLLQWIEGQAREGLGETETAELLFRESHDGFVDLGEVMHAAIVSLELARLGLEKGRTTEVLRLASEALPVLESLKLPEAREALAMLHQALENGMVDAAVLEAARSTLVRVHRGRLPGKC